MKIAYATETTLSRIMHYRLFCYDLALKCFTRMQLSCRN